MHRVIMQIRYLNSLKHSYFKSAKTIGVKLTKCWNKIMLGHKYILFKPIRNIFLR